MNKAAKRYHIFPAAALGFIAAVTLALRLAAHSVVAGTAEVLWLFLLCGLLILLSLKRQGLGALRFSRPCLLASAAMTVSTFFSFLLNSRTLEGRPLLKAAFAALVFLAYALLFQALGRLHMTSLGARREGERRLPLPALLGLGAVFLLVLALEYRPLYPYAVSGDSLNQWAQIHGTIPYNTVHAIGHTIFLKALLRLWDDFTVVVWFQILAVTGFSLWLAAFFYRRGLSLPLIGFALTMGLIWTNAVTDACFYPWKDTPAALCLGAVSLLMARLTEEERPLSTGGALALGAALSGSLLFRLNGIVAFAVCGLCCFMLLWKRRRKRQLAAMLLAAVLTVGGVSLYSGLVLRPEKLENGFALQVFGAAIAAVVHDDALTPEELEEIDRVLPVDWMREKYGESRNKRALLWDESGSKRIEERPTMAVLNNDFVIQMGENKGAVLRLFFRLLPGHFPTMARDILGSMAIVWMQDTLLFTASHVFWAVVVGWGILQLRLRRAALLPFLPCLCNTLSIMASAATGEPRYLLPTFMLAPFFVLYLLWQRHRQS